MILTFSDVKLSFIKAFTGIPAVTFEYDGVLTLGPPTEIILSGCYLPFLNNLPKDTAS